ncbi:MAG: gliding motility-associated C-terminal domain-containing protein, partial [Flavobacteriales bacterium]|nr:gliding motility-associated C-terminal domain-containing protein [Flavobacteriales bacterium]
WGEKIFESHKKFEPWNGTYKNKLVPNGVYVWKLTFNDLDGDNQSRIGHVTIVK